MKAIPLKRIISVSAATMLVASAANANPFVNFSLLGSTTDNGSDWSSTLTVTSGQTVYFEVVAGLAGSGTSNTQKSYTLGTQTPTTDGIASLAFQLSDGASQLTSTPTLNSAWVDNPYTSPGTATGAKVTAIYAQESNGKLGATSNVQVLTGSFAAAKFTSDTLSGAFDGTAGAQTAFTASVKTTGAYSNKALYETTGSAASSDPYVGYASLTLNESSGTSPIVSLGTAAPTGYGTQQGTIMISGSNGSYTAGKATFSNTSSGYVQTQSFNPGTDQELYVLDVQGTNASSLLSTIVSDINNAGISGLSASTTSNSTAFANIFGSDTNLVYLTETTGVGTQPYLGFNFANDSSLSGLSFDGIAAVPEPASLSLLGLGGLAMLRRRRTTRFA